MKVTFRQRGGYAGLSLGCELTAEDLSAEEREALESLLSGEAGPGADPGARARDVLTYELSVEGQDEEPRTFVLTGAAPDALRPLLDRCTRELGPRPME